MTKHAYIHSTVNCSDLAVHCIPMTDFITEVCTFLPTPTPLSGFIQKPICFLYVWAWFYLFACFFFFFFFYMPHISEIIWYLSFSVWLILVSITPSGSIYFITNCKILFFGWLVFCCLFIHWCLLSLFLYVQFSSVQFSSVVSDSATPWITACQALALLTDGAMNILHICAYIDMCVHISFWVSVFIFFG